MPQHDKNSLIDSLKGFSLPAAFQMACALSRKSQDDIAAEMGWSISMSNRVFCNQDYWPTLASIPRFCQVVGNTILAQWIIENVNMGLDVPAADAKSLLAHMRKLLHECSRVIEEGEKALDDNTVDYCEARRMNKCIADLLGVVSTMFASLQANINGRVRP